MSGVKLTPAERNQRDINKLKRETRDKEQRIRQQEIALENQRRVFESEINNLNQERKKQQNQFKSSIQNLKSDLRQQEEKRRIEMVQLEDDFSSKLSDLKNETQNDLTKQREEYLKIANEQDNKLNKLNDEIEKIHDKENAQISLVKNRISDLEIICNSLEMEFPQHEIFEPNQLNEIKTTIKEAKSNLETFPQSSHTLSTGAYKLINQLRKSLVQKRNRHQYLYSETIAVLESIKSLTENDDIEISKKLFNIDEWTNEGLSDLKGEINSSSKELKDSKDSLDIDDLEERLSKAKDLEKNYDNLLDLVHSKVLASRDRFLIGKEIKNTLLESGNFLVVGSNGFESADPKQRYLLKLKTSNHPGSAEIDIIIEPAETDTQSISNNIIFNFSDNLDEQTRKNRMRTIGKLLQEKMNINIGAVQELSQDSVIGLNDAVIGQAVKKGSNGLPNHIKEKLNLPQKKL